MSDNVGVMLPIRWIVRASSNWPCVHPYISENSHTFLSEYIKHFIIHNNKQDVENAFVYLFSLSLESSPLGCTESQHIFDTKCFVFF